jgi:hypothetical protein
MPKTADDVLGGLLSTAYQLDEAGVASLKEEDGSFKDDALDFLKKKDAERIKAIKGDVDAIGEKRFGEGKALSLGKLEKELREEYGYADETKRGKELVKELIALQLKAASATDEAKIKASKEYRDIERQLADERAGFDKRLADKEAEVISRYQGERDTQTVLDEAAVIFDAWEPVLPGDAAKAANQRRIFLEQLRGFKFKVTQADGKTDILPMKPDGSGRMEDDHGHPITLRQLVESRAGQLFDKKASQERTGAPDPNKVGGGSGGGSGKYPATMTKAEYLKAQDEAMKNLKGEDRTKAVAALKLVQVVG